MNVNPDYNKLAAIKEHFEGYFPLAYKDTGNVWTIGFGSTFNYDKNRKVMQNDTITKQDAIRFMQIEDQIILKQLN